jgi:hypothetical protein
VASSTRMEMAVAMSLKSLASDTLSLNIPFPRLMHVLWGIKDLQFAPEIQIMATE